MKTTREVFFELFGVHPPAWAPAIFVSGVRYELIEDEIAELERLLEVCP